VKARANSAAHSSIARNIRKIYSVRWPAFEKCSGVGAVFRLVWRRAEIRPAATTARHVSGWRRRRNVAAEG